MLAGTPAPADLAVDPGPIAELELLPGWYDDWVLAVRERLQLRLLHALEALSRLLRRPGRPDAAVEAVHVAVLAEPLRESGQRALIEAHQAAGDWVAARRQYDAFRSILRREIGVEPSAELTRGRDRRRTRGAQAAVSVRAPLAPVGPGGPAGRRGPHGPRAGLAQRERPVDVVEPGEDGQHERRGHDPPAARWPAGR